MDSENKKNKARPTQRRVSRTGSGSGERASRTGSNAEARRSTSRPSSERQSPTARGAEPASQKARRRRQPDREREQRRSRSAGDARRRPSEPGSQDRPPRRSDAQRTRNAQLAQKSGQVARKKKKRKAPQEAVENWNIGDVAKQAGKAILSNRIATIVVAVIVVLAVGGVGDTLMNWGKAYGNVKINDLDVGGMTKDEIVTLLDETYSSKSTSRTVTVYADEDTMLHGTSETDEAERTAQAEEMSVEEADAAVKMWTTNIYDLGGSLPFEETAQAALDAGREGGPFNRFGLMLFGKQLPFDITFDEAKLDAFATGVDRSVGELRADATVVFEDGKAKPVEGHAGVMVDRDEFGKKISDILLGIDDVEGFVAQPVAAPSRTTFEQAQAASDGINRTIAAGATFSYEGYSWTASTGDLASWTRIEVGEFDGAYDLKASIDEALAIPAVVSGVHANVTSEDVTVTINKIADELIVHTEGSGIIPEVAPAVAELGAALYGDDGRQWSDMTVATPFEFEIESSNAPGALTFDQACELGILTVIGEYTTEFSNYEGTENRNHNIMTAADLLDGSIVEANGGIWSFNENSGDTTKDPPFASAGSIIDGEHVDSIGGGICQVATTVYNSAYEAGLPIVERHNHTEHMHSYPDGRDAAVSYGEWDLKWENDLPSDIVLRLSYTDHSVTAKLYSVYTGRVVTSVQSEWVEGDTYTTKFEEDEWLYAGQYYTKTAGEDGSSISVTRTVVDATGAELIKETIYSVYSPKKEVIVVGPGTDTKPLEHKPDTSSNEDENTGEQQEW